MPISLVRYLLLTGVSAGLLLSQDRPPALTSANIRNSSAGKPAKNAEYLLGPDDQITIRVMEVEELNDKMFRVDMAGYIRVPLAGHIHVAGMTVEQVALELTGRLKTYVLRPDVSVSLAESRSQPVSVIGAVRTPGVHQVQGRKSLVEMLSLAGGVDAAAGPAIKITRRREWGRIPLPSAVDDPSGEFSVATVSIKSILQADNPEENILVQPYDVISVPRAEMVYVIGQVARSGGFTLHERETMTVLQALSLAGGLDRTASPKNTRILRAASGTQKRDEVPIDLKKILEGKAEDFALVPEDILFIPSSAPKKAAIRAAEAAIQLGTGLAVFHR